MDIQRGVIEPNIAKHKHIKRQFEWLVNFQASPPEKIMEDWFRLYHWPQTLKISVHERISEIEFEKGRFMERLVAEKREFEHDIAKYSIIFL